MRPLRVMSILQVPHSVKSSARKAETDPTTKKAEQE
jgi:hypothetical protein